MSLVRCPTCGKSFDSASSRSVPFCSPRCRQIDLNRWLSEEQRLPYENLSGFPPETQEDDDD